MWWRVTDRRRVKELESAGDEAQQWDPKLALKLYKDTAEVVRRLGTKHSNKRRARLARSLDKLGYSLIQSKEIHLAQDAYRESLGLYRVLSTSDPRTYRGELAYSLNNLGFSLDVIELYSEARAVYEEVVEIRRELYAFDPNAFRSKLAYSLHDFACSLDRLEIYPEAQSAYQEAIELRRVLYASHPNMYRANLAHSLHHLGISFDKRKLPCEARDAYQEAVQLRRVLYTARPNVYRASLSDSLYNLGIALKDLKLYPAARDVYREASDHYRVLCDSNPQVYRAILAHSLYNLGFALNKLELYSQARYAYQDAADLFQVLYAGNSDTYHSILISITELLASANYQSSEPSEPSPCHSGESVPSQFAKSALDDGLSREPATLINVKWVPEPACRGGYALVFRGSWNGCTVALKQLKPPRKAEKLQKRIRREALIWQQQKHRNILPFLGVFTDLNNPDQFVYMISPWQENGNLQQFLENNPDADLMGMVFGVASALEYLHGQSPQAVVHGDLRAVNILVSEDRVPQLADFGLACLAHDGVDEPGLLSADTSTANRGGNIRWLAPELLDDDGDDQGRPRFTPASDIWSFAMVIIEVFTNKVPYAYIRGGDFRVRDLIMRGERPPRPENPALCDTLWDYTNRCWEKVPEKRPSANALVSVLASL